MSYTGPYKTLASLTSKRRKVYTKGYMREKNRYIMVNGHRLLSCPFISTRTVEEANEKTEQVSDFTLRTMETIAIGALPDDDGNYNPQAGLIMAMQGYPEFRLAPFELIMTSIDLINFGKLGIGEPDLYDLYGLRWEKLPIFKDKSKIMTLIQFMEKANPTYMGKHTVKPNYLDEEKDNTSSIIITNVSDID